MQKANAILSTIFERQRMLKTVLITLVVLFITGIFIILMYAGGI